MSAIDTVIVILILIILILLVWSRVMQQTVLDTLREIKTFVQEVGTTEDGG